MRHAYVCVMRTSHPERFTHSVREATVTLDVSTLSMSLSLVDLMSRFRDTRQRTKTQFLYEAYC